MSVLTKIFVILLVICSLLLAAGVTVFVNRVEDFRVDRDSYKSQIGAAKRELLAVNASLQKTEQDLSQARQDSIKELGGRDIEIQKLNATIAQKDGDLAQQKKDAQVTAAQNKAVADALRASEEQNKGLQQGLAEVRTQNAEYARKNAELNEALSKGNSTVAALTQQLRYQQEVTKDLHDRLMSMSNGGGPASRPAGAPMSRTPSDSVATATPPLNGVVREVSNIGGLWYATISLGGADNVAKGMRFTAFNLDTGEFYGTVTIDSVQPHEAIGRLEGPKVSQVKANTEVRTQL